MEMNEQFIPYEQALVLKELGFNEECFGYYENQDKKLIVYYNNKPLTEQEEKRPSLYRIDYKNSTLPQWATAAPIYQQTFRWFRENHDIHSEFFVDDNKTFGFLISQFVGDDRVDNPLQRKYSTYEESELVCLNKLIEIVKNKQNG